MVEFYKEEFAAGRMSYDSPEIKESYDDSKWVVYNRSSGKVLKNISYKLADFNEMLQK